MRGEKSDGKQREAVLIFVLGEREDVVLLDESLSIQPYPPFLFPPMTCNTLGYFLLIPPLARHPPSCLTLTYRQPHIHNDLGFFFFLSYSLLSP